MSDKVVLVCRQFVDEGIGAYARHLVRQLHPQFEFSVICQQAQPLDELSTLPLEVLAADLNEQQFAREVNQRLSQHDDVIVHSLAWGVSADISSVAQLPEWFIQQSWWQRLLLACQPSRRQWQTRLYQQFDIHLPQQLVLSSEWQREALLQHSPQLPLGLYQCIHWGVELPQFYSDEQLNQHREQLGLTPNRQLLLLTATGRPLAQLTQALNWLTDLPQADLVLLVEHPREQRKLEKLLKKSALGERVLLRPSQDFAAYLPLASLYLHRPQQDVIGARVLQAMACAVPVVMSGSKHCGLAASLTSEQATLIDNDDERSWLMAIDQLLHQPKLYQLLQANGLALAAEHEWPLVARRYAQCYRDARSVAKP